MNSNTAQSQWRLVCLCVAVLGLLHCEDFREDEFECEHAVARLQECCPSFVGVDHDFCVYVEGCESDDGPAYTIAESECIQAASCESIVQSVLCEEPEKLGTCQ